MSLRVLTRNSNLCVLALLLLTAWAGRAGAQSCVSASDTTIGCIGLYKVGTCDAFCPYGLHSTPPALGTWQVETNFVVKQQGAKALTLIQAPPDKINRAQALARKVLGKKGMNYRNVATVQQAIAAVDSLYNATPVGKVHLMIIGHGSPGSIKLGEDDLDNAANQAKFVGAMTGKLANLTLFGCRVAQGQAGQAFVQKLSGQLGDINVKAWTQPVAADTNDFWSVTGSKKDVPVADPRLIALLSIALLAFGARAVARSRRGRSEIA
jgi:Domain of unknown function (DUF4347)